MLTVLRSWRRAGIAASLILSAIAFLAAATPSYAQLGATTTSVTSSLNPSITTLAVTFTASIDTGSGGIVAGGTITITDGGNLISSVSMPGNTNQVTFTTPTLSIGSHSIIASYSGDSTFAGSDSPTLTQVVNPVPTTTVAGTSLSPSTFGQSVTYSATVSSTLGGFGTPSGTVTFTDTTTSTSLGSAALNGGGGAAVASSVVVAGGHTIIADYSGSATFASSSGAVAQTVNKSSTTTTLVTSKASTVSGESVMFTATVSAVAPGAGTRTGTVMFVDTTTSTTLGSAAVDASGAATLASTALTVAVHTITATYNGDANFLTSNGNVAQTVGKGATTTTVAAAPNPSVFGQSVTFTATVTATAPAAGTRTGTVTFTIDGTPQAPATVDVSGLATFATSLLAVAGSPHAVSASYSGDANFSASARTLAGGQTVSKGTTSTTVSAAPAPSTLGQPVTFTATVAATAPAAGTRTGTVTFTIDGTPQAPAAVDGSGVATFTTSSLSAAGSPHVVSAAYNGDAHFNRSSGTLAGGQTVNKGATSTTVASPLNPSMFGQSVTFTATVTVSVPATGAPTGTVAFSIDGAPGAQGAVNAGGQATFATSSLTVAGSPHAVTASYSGDANLNGSTGILAGGQAVSKGATGTTVAAAPNPSTLGQSVTFTATVAAAAPATGTPTGTMTFVDTTTGTTLGSPALVSGAASVSTSALATGIHTISATYNGDGNFSTSNGSVTQVIGVGGTSTTLAATPNPSTLGQTVTLTSKVTAIPPASGTPTGSVTFKEGANTLGSGTLSSGTASLSLSSLLTGSHNITASYGGDSTLASSTSAVLAVVVDRACADMFADATAISGGNGTIFGSNANATGESGEPDHAGASAPLNSVWCRWTAAANGSVSFDTTGSLFNTTLAAYTGAAVNALTPVASNDNLSAGNDRSRITFTASQGVTYYIAIDGAGAATGRYLLNWAQAAAGAVTYAAVLPYGRSVGTGTPATAFATIINAGSTTATACSLAQPPGFPGTFVYQTTNPDNSPSGTPNTPADITAGGAQSYQFGITPTQDLVEAEIGVVFSCTNKPVTVTTPGVNTMLLSASAGATPDLIAISVTPSHDGIVSIPGNTGLNFFVAAATNIGTTGTITATADDGGKGLPLTLTICETDLSTGACINPPTAGSSTSTSIANGGTVGYTVFVQGSGSIPFDPANNRLFLRLRSADGITRGATSVATRTQ